MADTPQPLNHEDVQSRLRAIDQHLDDVVRLHQRLVKAAEDWNEERVSTRQIAGEIADLSGRLAEAHGATAAGLRSLDALTRLLPPGIDHFEALVASAADAVGSIEAATRALEEDRSSQERRLTGMARHLESISSQVGQLHAMVTTEAAGLRSEVNALREAATASELAASNLNPLRALFYEREGLSIFRMFVAVALVVVLCHTAGWVWAVLALGFVGVVARWRWSVAGWRWLRGRSDRTTEHEAGGSGRGPSADHQ